jgi:hypothetical protein
MQTRNLDEFYRNGLVPLEPSEWQEKAYELFMNPNFPEISASQVEAAVAKISTKTTKGYIHFGLDDKFLISYAGHYLIHGSEYLAAIAIELGRQTGRDFKRVLRDIGKPTVFICDIPVAKVSFGEIYELSGTLLAKIFDSILSGHPVSTTLDFTITLDEIVSPECIVSHYHPDGIPNQERYY